MQIEKIKIYLINAILFTLLINFNVIAVANQDVSINLNRTALVIGNSNYQVSPLKNPYNDASAMGVLLKNNGFEVIQTLDASRRQMEMAINQFGRRLRNGGIGFFYYAGHGVQLEGENYLIPTDISVESESDIKFDAVNVGRVLGKMHDAKNSLNVVVLDACRNNPFARSFRSTRAGLAKIDAPTGTIIAYATSPGSVASDGDESNGLYTKYLLKYLDEPNLKIEDVFKSVRISVVNESEKKQVPWESSSLIGNFILNVKEVNIANTIIEKKVTQKTKNNPSQGQEIENIQDALEDEYWGLISSSKDRIDFEHYLNDYPSGRYVRLAKLILRKFDNVISIIDGEWTAWPDNGEAGKSSKYFTLPDGSIKWEYTIKDNKDEDGAGIYLPLSNMVLSNKKIHVKLTSKSAVTLYLAIYSFVDGYSKKDDFYSHVVGQQTLEIKSGENEYFLNANDFKIPQWWTEEFGNPSVNIDLTQAMGLEFYTDAVSEHDQLLADSVVIKILKVID